MAVQVGVDSFAHNVVRILSGVNGTSIQIKEGYIGFNGTAHLFWKDNKTFLYNNGDECVWITGGWNGTLVFESANGTAYGMVPVTKEPDYLYGGVSSTSGSLERCIYGRTLNAIDLTPYSKLCMDYEHYSAKMGNTPQCRFGAFDHTKPNMRWSKYDRYFYAFDTMPYAKNSDYELTHLELDLSDVNTAADILFYSAFSNLNANYKVRISKIWLEKEQQS